MPILGFAYLVLAIGFGLEAVFDRVNRGPATLLAAMFAGMTWLMYYTYP